MFKKKFKVRVKHYYEREYVIQYAHYRFIRIWHTISWFPSDQDVSLDYGADWHPVLFTGVAAAEKAAKKFKTYEDVIQQYIPEYESEKKFYKRQEEYYKKIIPYNKKIIL